jgi:CHAT domain-containing protein
MAADYLFQREVLDLDLKGVDLVTISACDTGRGRTIRGEGIQAFSRAFLAAGAASTVTSLWRVADEPTAAFMKQFYYALARGQTKSAALRSAKLELLHSRSALAHPRYWAAFVLTGDGLTPAPLAMQWSSALLAGAGIAGVIAWIARRRSGLRDQGRIRKQG